MLFFCTDERSGYVSHFLYNLKKFYMCFYVIYTQATCTLTSMSWEKSLVMFILLFRTPALREARCIVKTALFSITLLLFCLFCVFFCLA